MRPWAALPRVYAASIRCQMGPGVSPPIRDPPTLFQPDGVASRYVRAASQRLRATSGLPGFEAGLKRLGTAAAGGTIGDATAGAAWVEV